MSFITGLYLSVLLVVCFLFFKKFKLLDEDINISDHKKLILNNRLPILLGGFYLCLITLIFLSSFNQISKIIIILFFILGLMSDKNFLANAKARLILQFFLLFVFVIVQKISIQTLNIEYFDYLLNNNFFNLLFTVFCFAILINGTNFIDGLNGLVLGYYIFVIISLFYLNSLDNKIIVNNFDDLEILIFSMTLLLILNFFGYIFLGDGGSYIVGLIIGYYLINLNNLNINISPYYIAVLLWYPAFENLFSLLRRLANKINVSKPDNSHLHQLLYKFFENRKHFEKSNINLISSLIILLYNIPTFLIANMFYSKTNYLVTLILVNVAIYLLIYNFLSKKCMIKKKF